MLGWSTYESDVTDRENYRLRRRNESSVTVNIAFIDSGDENDSS